MQKKIIALAIAAAFSAPAFADVSFYGVADAFVATLGASGKQSANAIGSGGLSTSRLGANASTDLGDGMKVLVNLEYRLDITSNQPVGSNPSGMTGQSGPARQQMLGLAGGFGTVAAGRLQTAGYSWEVKFDPLAGSSVSGLQSTNSAFLIGTVAAHARANNAIAYISPDFSGFSFAVNYALPSENFGSAGTGNATGNASTQLSATLLAANYVQGPLAVGVVYDKQSGDKAAAWLPGVTPNISDVALGASYDFGVAKVLATYQTSKNDDAVASATATTSADKAMSLSGVIPAGPGAVVATYAKKQKASTVASDDVTAMTVAYAWSLSKTTTVYGAYEKVSNATAGTAGISAYGNDLVATTSDVKATMTPTAGGSATILAVGVKYAF
jgi:predicted porin